LPEALTSWWAIFFHYTAWETLGQGITGTIRGTWTITGNVITLNIDGAENENVLNKTTRSTIERFKQNELVVRSSSGETSTFVKAL
jgi:hypothetical protein